MSEYKARILIVEDDESLYKMYQTKFEKEWYEVVIARNWLEASSKIKDFQPHLILLDIMMPDMDWFETLSVIKTQSNIDAKIVMLSNLDKKEDIEKAMELGADWYLIKANVTPKQVVEKVESILAITTDIEQKIQDSSAHIKIKCPHCGEYIEVNLDLIR